MGKAKKRLENGIATVEVITLPAIVKQQIAIELGIHLRTVQSALSYESNSTLARYARTMALKLGGVKTKRAVILKN